MSTGGPRAAGVRPIRVRQAHVEWVRERLGDRDQAIIESVNRLHLITGLQLERLHFAELAPAARARIRRRVLARLVSWRVLLPLERRIGGVRAGSSSLVFALDTAGQQLVRLTRDDERPARRPGEPSVVLLGHRLGVTEAYVSLTELSRAGDFELAEFTTEPACWWPNGYGGWLKPDAYLRLAAKDYSDSWWLEQDMATEHLPVIKRKLGTYLEFAARGLGPHDVMPRVLVSVPSEQRKAAVAGVMRSLPEPASQLFRVTTHALAPNTCLWCSGNDAR